MFTKFPLRSKLLLSMCLTVAAAIGLATLIELGFAWHRERQEAPARLAEKGYRLCSHCLGSYFAADETGNAARALLRQFVEEQGLVSACVYHPNGALLACHQAGDLPQELQPATMPSAGSRWVKGHLEVVTDIAHQGQPLGRLAMVVRPSLVPPYFLEHAHWKFALATLALILMLGLTVQWQRPLLRPLAELASLAERIRDSKNLGLRAAVDSPDEVGQLAAAFNRMLDQVQQQEKLARDQAVLLQTTLDSLGEGVIAADKNGKMTLFNRKAREILGQGISNELPKAWPEEYGVVDAVTRQPVPYEELPLVRALHGESIYQHELCLQSKVLNEDTWLSVTANPVRDASGGSQGGVITFRDITRDRQVVEDLRWRKACWDSLLNHSVDYVLMLNREGDINFVNRARKGETRESLLGQSVFDLLPDAGVPFAKELLETVYTSGRAVNHERMLVPDPDGTICWYDLLLVPIIPQERVERVLLMARDVTQRVALQQQLIRVADDEKERLGRELHDGLCQTLVGASLTLGLLEAQLQPGPSQGAVGRLHQLSQILDGCLRDARQVSRLLNPVDIDEFGLDHALHALAQQVSNTTGIDCHMRAPSPWLFAGAHPGAAQNLFRIVQEAVNNAVRHSGASEILIEAAGGTGWLKLSVTDNGCGLPPAAQRPRGMGLRSMRYRAEMLSASLELVGAEGEGTVVRFHYQDPSPRPNTAQEIHA